MMRDSIGRARTVKNRFCLPIFGIIIAWKMPFLTMFTITNRGDLGKAECRASCLHQSSALRWPMVPVEKPAVEES